MKRPFTLVETLVAFALASGLISLLLGFLYQAHLADKGREVRKVRERYALYQRLDQVIPQTTKIIQTEPESLVFIYNNGIDEDPMFSSLVLARLYLNEGRLILSTWPHPKKWEERPHRAEILCGEATALSFAFFEPPNWLPSWDEEDDLPAMIRITTKGEKVSFPLIAVDKPVRYVDKKPKTTGNSSRHDE